MRGSLTKRYKNSWTFRFDVGKDPATGARRQRTVSIKGNKKEAERQAARILSQHDEYSPLKPNRISVGQFLDKWLIEYAIINLSPRTVSGYESIIRYHLKPELGKIRLTKLTAEMVRAYYAMKIKTNSAQTIKHHHTLLHKALETAIDWDMVDRNIANKVKPPKVSRRDMLFWNYEEVSKFLKTAEGTAYYSLFYTALYTGMRRSEMLALRWRDIDFKINQVFVSRSVHYVGKRFVFSTTKTATSNRSITIPPSLLKVLNEHKEEQFNQMATAGIIPDGNSLVFSRIDGSPMLPSSVSHAWVRLVKKAGVLPIRFHDARHTHASLLLMRGIHPKIVQERLGHSSIQITMDTYSHVIPNLQEAAANEFDLGMDNNE